MTPRPREDPAWYQSKACFYIFNFTVEIIGMYLAYCSTLTRDQTEMLIQDLVIFLYIVVRVDKRFWVPNGSHGAGDYSREDGAQEKEGIEDRIEDRVERAILPEEEVFDDVPEAEFESQKERRGPTDVEARG